MFIDKYLAETVCMEFGYIDKLCDAIDNYIKNFATSYIGNNTEYVYENIVRLIKRKNKILRFRNKILHCVGLLKIKDRQIWEALTKLKNLKKEDICLLLDINERTFYRRIEKFYTILAKLLEQQNENNFILDVCNSECFISSKYYGVKTRRQSYSRGIFGAHQREGLYE